MRLVRFILPLLAALFLSAQSLASETHDSGNTDQPSIGEVTSRLDELSTQVAEILSRLKKLETHERALAEEVEAHLQEVNASVTAVAQALERVSGVLSAQLDAQQNRISELEDKIDKLGDKDPSTIENSDDPSPQEGAEKEQSPSDSSLQQLALFPQDYIGKSLLFRSAQLTDLRKSGIEAKDMPYYQVAMTDKQGHSLNAFKTDVRVMISETLARKLSSYIDQQDLRYDIELFVGFTPYGWVLHIDRVRIDGPQGHLKSTFTDRDPPSRFRQILPELNETWLEVREAEKAIVEGRR